MKTWMACLIMACVIGNAAAQTTTRGNSDDKQHPKCEGQHDCRDYGADQSKGTTGKSTETADASGTNGSANNTAGKKGGKVAKGAKAGKAGAASGVNAGVGIAAGVGAIAIGASAGGGGHHGSDRPRPSSP